MKIKFIGVYAIQRWYGGPEEGGWWYNTAEHIKSIYIENETEERVEAIFQELREEFLDDGDIYSVLGGSAFEFIKEEHQGEYETLERPTYE